MKVSVEAPEREHLEEVIPHREDVLIDYVDTFQEYLVLYERRNGLRQIRITNFGAPTNVRYIEFPEPAYSVELESNPEFEMLAFFYDHPLDFLRVRKWDERHRVQQIEFVLHIMLKLLSIFIHFVHASGLVSIEVNIGPPTTTSEDDK